jgi:hypothetical protein
MKSKSSQLSQTIINTVEYFIEENVAYNKKNMKRHSKKFEMTRHIIALYFLLFVSLKKDSGNSKNEGRLLYARFYLVSIINNFLAMKTLFETGLHIQFQIILRSQMEYINTMIAFIGDDSFFNHFCKQDKKITTSVNTITPELRNIDKAIKRIIPKIITKNSDSFASAFFALNGELYNYFSEVVHGNITRVSLQANHHRKNEIGPALGGQSRPYVYLKNKIIASNVYYQFGFQMLIKSLEEEDLIDISSSDYKRLLFYRENYIKGSLNWLKKRKAKN